MYKVAIVGITRMKNKGFILRLSNKQMEKLNYDVSLTSLSREAYDRCLLAGYKPREQPSNEFFEVIAQLRVIGNNLNQIAMIANRSGYINNDAYTKEVINLRKEILEIRKMVCEPIKIENGNNCDMGCK